MHRQAARDGKADRNPCSQQVKHRRPESHHDKIARLTESHIVHVRRFAQARRRDINAGFHVLGSRLSIFFCPLREG